MAITSITQPQAPYDPTAGTTDRIAGGSLGKEDFLKLLVAQLSNQDPMSPSDPTEFVAQLTQFSSLEQLMGVRESLDLVSITQTAGTSAQMVGFIGKTVAYDDGSLTLGEAGEAQPLKFRLDGAAQNVTVRIFDDKGNTLREIEVGKLGAGPGSVTFDGKDSEGNPLPAGDYKVELVATNVDGNTVGGTMTGNGLVTGVTFESGYPELLLADGRKISLGQVLQVLATAGAAAPSAEPVPDDAPEASAPPAAADIPSRF